jgi:hypothetical protein
MKFKRNIFCARGMVCFLIEGFYFIFFYISNKLRCRWEINTSLLTTKNVYIRLFSLWKCVNCALRISNYNSYMFNSETDWVKCSCLYQLLVTVWLMLTFLSEWKQIRYIEKKKHDPFSERNNIKFYFKWFHRNASSRFQLHNLCCCPSSLMEKSESANIYPLLSSSTKKLKFPQTDVRKFLIIYNMARMLNVPSFTNHSPHRV